MLAQVDNIAQLELALTSPRVPPPPMDALARQTLIANPTIVEYLILNATLNIWQPAIFALKTDNALPKTAPRVHVLVLLKEELALLTLKLAFPLVLMASGVFQPTLLELANLELSKMMTAMQLTPASNMQPPAMRELAMIGMIKSQTITAPCKLIAINPPLASMDIAKMLLMEIAVLVCAVPIKLVFAMEPPEPLAKMLMIWMFALTSLKTSLIA